MAADASVPIVLIHGFPLDGDMWRGQMEALAGMGHRVLTPNVAGFGAAPAPGTPWPRERCSIEAFADQVHELIEAESEGEGAIVGGFSMGGYILLALLRDHPESVRAAMFFDTRADADSPEAKANRLKAIADVEARGVGPLADVMVEKLLSKHAPAALRREAREMMLRQHPESVAGALHAMARRRDQTDLLPTLTLPVLYVVGADDAITPPSVALGMHQRTAGSMLVQVANAGHLANWEAPEAVNRAVAGFLATVGS